MLYGFVVPVVLTWIMAKTDQCTDHPRAAARARSTRESAASAFLRTSRIDSAGHDDFG